MMTAFLAHGSPMTALDHGDAFTSALAAFGARTAGARAIVVVSAHWQTSGPVRVTTWSAAPLVYDFSGFADELYRLTYPAPGDPAMAATALAALETAGIPAVPEPSRGLDHGAWVPLRIGWPEARIPVIAVSLPYGADPRQLFELGRALRPLRDQGVLVAGSGGLVHNLRQLNWADKNGPPMDWALAFDSWIAARVTAADAEALFNYRETAPHAVRAVPTTEHFDPLFVALGAAFEGEAAANIFEGFQHGSLSMRSVSWGERP
jgi:4,5-DOPA dioxygenase extradiol